MSVAGPAPPIAPGPVAPEVPPISPLGPVGFAVATSAAPTTALPATESAIGSL